MEITYVNDYISYISPMQDPLSANVVMITLRDRMLLYDVGCGHGIPEYLNNISGRKEAVLSHFHPDHIANFDKINLDELYVSKHTLGYTHRGVTDMAELMEGVEIIPLPSTHAKGSLALRVNEYLFTGDAFGPGMKAGKAVVNAGFLLEDIKILEKSPAKYVCESHVAQFVRPKEEILNRLKSLYMRRDKEAPYIDWDDRRN